MSIYHIYHILHSYTLSLQYLTPQRHRRTITILILLLRIFQNINLIFPRLQHICRLLPLLPLLYLLQHPIQLLLFNLQLLLLQLTLSNLLLHITNTILRNITVQYLLAIPLLNLLLLNTIR